MRARKDAVERLLAAYRRYYTITRFDGVRESPGEGLREAKDLTAPFLPKGRLCQRYVNITKGQRDISFSIRMSYGRRIRKSSSSSFPFLIYPKKSLMPAGTTRIRRGWIWHTSDWDICIRISHRSFCATRSMRKPGSPWKSASITRPSASPSTDGWSTMRDVWHFVTIGSISIRQDAAWKRA